MPMEAFVVVELFNLSETYCICRPAWSRTNGHNAIETCLKLGHPLVVRLCRSLAKAAVVSFA